jgi:hypothetical protein
MKTQSLRKWVLFLSMIISMGLILLSCQKDNTLFPEPSTLPKGLIGTWVETHTLTDTIVFNSNNEKGAFLCIRGFGIYNGYRLPLTGSGPYAYTMFSDSINLVFPWTDSMANGNFYFRFDEPNLTISIGKFCKYIATKKSILTFRKIN